MKDLFGAAPVEAGPTTSEWSTMLLPKMAYNRGWQKVIFMLILGTDGWGIICEIVLRHMSLDLNDYRSMA